MSHQLIDIALAYARRGWPVLPLHTPNKSSCSCGQQCSSAGKHPRMAGGVHAASTERDTIISWWQKWPRANIGIATGKVSNLLVVDLDERHGGVDAWRAWEKDHPAQTSLIAKTGGGFHLFFDAQGHQIKSRVGVLPGVDVRADGGLVVAAGSLHHSGVNYSWISPENNQPSLVPAALLNLLEQRLISSTHSPAGDKILPGQRNDFLTSMAGILRRDGCSYDLIYRAINAVNQTTCSPALDQGEVEKIATGIARYAPKWGEVTSPASETLKLPDFDPNMLPHVMRDWVSDAAERMQVPPEFFAAPCLVAFASVIGKQVGIFPKAEDTWFVIPNLWGAIIARPGLFKSPAILEATSFVRGLAEQASHQYEIESAKSEINAESLKSQIEGLKEAIKKAARDEKSDGDIAEIQTRMQELRARLDSQSCVHRRFIVNDSTVEKLALILKENLNGVLLLRDELAGWGAMLNRREGDREFYLEAWNGSGSFTVDRIGRGTLHVPNLCLSIFGGIQPSKLDALGSPLGGGSDGLLQRFQLLVYPDTQKAWKNIDRKPKLAEYQALARIFAKASNIALLYPEVASGLRFSADAQDMFSEWRAKLELRLRSDEIESEDFEGHLSKYRSLVPSLSLLFEIMQVLAEGRNLREVGRDSLSMALSWAFYLEQHAKKVYSEKLSGAQKGTVLLGQKITSGAVKDGDSLRSIYRRHWSWLDTPEKLEKAVARLQDCGWVLVETISNSTGKSSIIRINPSLKHG